VSPGEIIPFFTPDTRIGGWGPLFGGVLILAAGMLLIAACTLSPYLRRALPAVLVLAGSILIFPEPWWARFAPQVWVLPFVPILLSYYAGGAAMRILRTAALMALSVNVLFVLAIYTGAETWASLYLHRHLSILSQMSREKPLPADFQLYYSNRVRLAEAGVQFHESSAGSCADPVFFDRVGRRTSETATLICADREAYDRRGGRLLPGLTELRGLLVRDVLKGGATTDGTPLIR
jgi:hypothetical protein